MPQTEVAYMPLIDMTPSYPHMMVTALSQAQRLSAQVGQYITAYTCEQQLHRVALNVIGTYPEQFANDVLILVGICTCL